jgi:hypothetical protein
MTILLNEIFVEGNLKKSFVIAAADRRITLNGNYNQTKKKIFPIHNLKSAISYFGLAGFYKEGKFVYFGDWIPEYIRRNSSKYLKPEDFISNFRNDLNDVVDPQLLKTNASGFHYSFYNDKGFPDFFYFSNINGMDYLKYTNLANSYQKPSSHYLSRDAMKDPPGWDGTDLGTCQNYTSFRSRIYRNGDIRAHAYISDEIDNFMKKFITGPDFKKINTPVEMAKYVKFKFEIASYIYKKWNKYPVVAKPIDVYLIRNQ